MVGWEHADQFGRACMVPVGFDQYLDSCGCTTPQPDPASPCGYAFGRCESPAAHAGCGRAHEAIDTCHDHVPTRCLNCQHPIREVGR